MSTTTTVYRFKLSNDIVDMVTSFAKIHQYDDRKTYKEAWEDWTNDNNNVITREANHLLEMGYEGDVIDKMYKAVDIIFEQKICLKRRTTTTASVYINEQ